MNFVCDKTEYIDKIPFEGISSDVPDNSEKETIVETKQKAVEHVKTKWALDNKDIIDHLEDDPVRFCPACNVFLNNVEDNASISSTLIHSLGKEIKNGRKKLYGTKRDRNFN